MKPSKPIEIDGRTGEGGGQLVRIAVALASVICQPIRITHVRGNRETGGLKSQHVSSIEWLVSATGATATGLEIGSKTLEFRPQRRPSELSGRKIKIMPDSSAASTLLIFQAIFPFLIFAGNSAREPIELELAGGTNVSFSLSYEYLDQVLLPLLEEHFGIVVERSLKGRGWSSGGVSRGTVLLKFTPLAPGETLQVRNPGRLYAATDFDIQAIDVSMIVPGDIHETLTRSLVRDLETLFPDAEVTFKVAEDSGRDARVYVLLVARSPTLRWGRDILTSIPKKAKGNKGKTCDNISRKLAKALYEEVQRKGVVDEFLQDQLVVFQALANGRTNFPRGDEESESLEAALAKLDIKEGGEELKRVKKTHEPFGEGSTHTRTARCVVAELLPKATWFNSGAVCEGVGMKMEGLATGESVGA